MQLDKKNQPEKVRRETHSILDKRLWLVSSYLIQFNLINPQGEYWSRLTSGGEGATVVGLTILNIKTIFFLLMRCCIDFYFISFPKPWLHGVKGQCTFVPAPSPDKQRG